MKRCRFTEEQIIGTLRPAEAGYTHDGLVTAERHLQRHLLQVAHKV